MYQGLRSINKSYDIDYSDFLPVCKQISTAGNGELVAVATRLSWQSLVEKFSENDADRLRRLFAGRFVKGMSTRKCTRAHSLNGEAWIIRAVISRVSGQISRVPLPPAGGRFFLSVVSCVVGAKTRKIKSAKK